MGSISDTRDFETGYHLPRGGGEGLRLAAQHHMLQSRQGWMIHPKIAKALADLPHPRIADVATGTGIWACEVAQTMPNAEVVGLDISDQQFGPQWTLPSNLSLGLYDLLEDVPSDLVGTFDFVHVRLLLCAGPAVDKSVFFAKFRSLLKPGGWLQWDDLAFPNVVVCETSSTSGIQTRSLESLPWMYSIQGTYLGMQSKAGWVHQFEKTAAAVGGFDNAARFEIPLRPHLLQLETELTLTVFTELADMLIQRRGPSVPGLEEEVSQALQELYDLAGKGLRFSYDWNVCIAQKTT